MRKIIVISTIILLNLILISSFATTNDKQTKMTPWQALEKLQQGNERFVKDKMLDRDLQQRVHMTKHGQNPFAIVLACIDSRNIPNIVFDQSIGDIFVARVAGNVLDNNILGSMEFATKIAGSKLIVIMGHTSCGAITGACENVKLGHLTALLAEIKPAVDIVKKEMPHAHCDDPKLINAIAKEHVVLEIHDLLQRSPVINKLVKTGQLGVVGAMQDLASGKVEFIVDPKLMPPR